LNDSPKEGEKKEEIQQEVIIKMLAVWETPGSCAGKCCCCRNKKPRQNEVRDRLNEALIEKEDEDQKKEEKKKDD